MEIKNWDFFDTPKPVWNRGAVTLEECLQEEQPVESRMDTNHLPNADLHTSALVKELQSTLSETGFSELSKEVVRVGAATTAAKFHVVIVGGPNVGKSTVANRIIGREVLPTGVLPTTALVTKISSGIREEIRYVGSKNEKKAFPLKPDAWNVLTFGGNKQPPRGAVFVSMVSKWLQDYGIDIIDTISISTDEEADLTSVYDPLLYADGAVVVTDATHALSMTEKAFMEARLLNNKVPKVLLAVNKLDLVSKNERLGVLQHIRNTVKSLHPDIPIFVAQDDISFANAIEGVYFGMHALRRQMESWATDSSRLLYRQRSACSRLLPILEVAKNELLEQERIAALEEDKRTEELNAQRRDVEHIRLAWEDIRLEILLRRNNCCKWLRDCTDEKSDEIVERLIYESSHANNPQQWWRADYPYRLKTEMTRLGSEMEARLKNYFASDIRNINELMKKKFGAAIDPENEELIDKHAFRNAKSDKEIRFADVSRERNKRRIMIAAATVATIPILATAHVIPIIGTVAISTAGGIISECKARNEQKEQQDEIKKTISADVPFIIDRIIARSEKRISAIYDRLIREVKSKESLWISSRLVTIEKEWQSTGKTTIQQIQEIRKQFMAIGEKIKKFTEGSKHADQ